MTGEPSGNGARAYPENMEQLLALIQRARTSWEEEIGRFSEAQLTELQDRGGWTAKDHIVHVAVWEGSLAAVLRGQPRYRAMGMDAETYQNVAPPDGYNEIIYAQHKEWPLEDVLLFSRRAYNQIIEALKTRSYEALSETFAEYKPAPAGEEEMPMRVRILRTYQHHYPEHLALIREIVESAK